jgi:hypothetical protein
MMTLTITTENNARPRRTSQVHKETAPGPGPRCVQAKRRGAAPVRRYCARALSDAKVLEIAVGTDLEKLIGQARTQHQRSGQRVWVWRLRDGLTVFEISEASIYAACA